MKNKSKPLPRQISYLADKRSSKAKTVTERAREMLLNDLKYDPPTPEIMEDPFVGFKTDAFDKKPTSVDQITKSWIRKNNQIESASDSKLATGRRGVAKRRIVAKKESENTNE